MPFDAFQMPFRCLAIPFDVFRYLFESSMKSPQCTTLQTFDHQERLVGCCWQCDINETVGRFHVVINITSFGWGAGGKRCLLNRWLDRWLEDSLLAGVFQDQNSTHNPFWLELEVEQEISEYERRFRGKKFHVKHCGASSPINEAGLMNWRWRSNFGRSY